MSEIQDSRIKDVDFLQKEDIIIENNHPRDINHLLAYELLLARERVHMTQKELAERTGIYQADISKLERGMGNPSLSTLQRIAEGLGMQLHIDFTAKKDAQSFHNKTTKRLKDC